MLTANYRLRTDSYVIHSMFDGNDDECQTANEHLKFKCVPIDGTLSQYVQKMKTAGFSMLGMENGAAIFQRMLVIFN